MQFSEEMLRSPKQNSALMVCVSSYISANIH
jgi:hypothetical protein